jgi:SAM-dependent methyltransferase
MRFVHYDWPLEPDMCPCDLHLCSYLRERDVRRKSLFHFGTGAHHVVGLRNQQERLENDILGITASPDEHARYVRLLIRSPSLGEHYKVLFADIYQLNAATLPVFDLVTLFHLCEFTSPQATEGRLGDAELVDLFLSKLAPGGRLIFYVSSDGRKKTAPIVERAVAEGKMTLEESYETLRVYRVKNRPWGASE